MAQFGDFAIHIQTKTTRKPRGVQFVVLWVAIVSRLAFVTSRPGLGLLKGGEVDEAL